MTDRSLRELERRARGGARDDEAAWLAARVRAGDLPRERVELAAWCGHEGARAVAGVGAAADRLDLDDWLRGLRRWRRAPARAALAAARLAWPMRVAHGKSCWRTELASPVPPAAERVLGAGEAAVEAPGRRTTETLIAALEALDLALVPQQPTGTWWLPPDRPLGSSWAPGSNTDWAWWVGGVALLAGRAVLEWDTRDASASMARQAALLTRDLVAVHPVAGEWSRPVRDVVAERLVAWALTPERA